MAQNVEKKSQFSSLESTVDSHIRKVIDFFLRETNDERRRRNIYIEIRRFPLSCCRELKRSYCNWKEMVRVSSIEH